MNQTIDVTNGAIRRTFPATLTEIKGKNITGDQVWITLGTADIAGAWRAPDSVVRPTPNSVVVQMLVPPDWPPGLYYVWVKLGDGDEVIPLRGGLVNIV